VIAGVHQPEHLPWLGFFDKLRQVDVFVLLDTTQFSKNGFQNRNRIKTPAGAAYLTAPVFHAGRSQQLIEEAELCEDGKWRRRSWDLLRRSYETAPHFPRHVPFFRDEVYGASRARLLDLNLLLIRYLAEQLGIGTEVVRASELGIYERGGTAVLLRICHALGADVYLSGRHGRDYLDESRFAADGIAVRYQDFRHPEYPQLWGAFVPQLSVIDLLFNCGQRSLDVIAAANPLPGSPAPAAP
jgi:hypothetical protein